MANAASIHATVQRIYDAALTANAWQPMLESVVDLMGGNHAMLFARDPARANADVAKYAGLDERVFAGFLSPEAAGWIEPSMRAAPPGAVVIQSRLVPDRDFERSDFYNDFVRPAGGFHGMAIGHATPTLSSLFVVCRRRQAGDFESKDAAVLQTLSPHLALALQVRQRLDVTDLGAAGAFATIDQLGAAFMIVDAKAAVVFANEAAVRLFRDGRGLHLDRDGICGKDAAASRTLRRLIARCAVVGASNGSAAGVVELPYREWQALRIAVAPFRPERIGLDTGWSARPLALLIVTDPAQERDARKAQLRRRFGLTPAEADVAMEITRGDGRKAAAARLGVADSTARMHLTRVFEKTGVHRQAELVRVVLQSGDEQARTQSTRLNTRAAPCTRSKSV
jgi:DNA-binding CsgD family transcriptional regulator